MLSKIWIRFTTFAMMVSLVATGDLCAQQLDIDRVTQMPNSPEPYEMRDWKAVAQGYDSLVFDFDLSGQYLPLIFWRTNTVNYPNHNSFGLHTVVGTTSPSSGEAINVLPAVISASLAGIDKSNQNGNNWVLMCEEYFNRRPEQNVYLNHPVASTGSDWWYETMPNVFFYQLYDMYPNTGDFEYQFTTVANRWLQVVDTLGGADIPWHLPNMNYRAIDLSTMTPNTDQPAEPEAAGAIAWILYNAYHQTQQEKYRIGAEWAMEFLNNQGTNPSYELQLPYGVYIAARMNAELGTTYDIPKLLNWCFTPDGNVRNWGVTLGNWGGYDCYGLVGEARYDGYAFTMNVFEQVGALVPMVRYDDRFARTIGKWVLNATNAARLFYPNYLPPENQDSEAWSYEYDPDSYIAHESMREDWNGNSPYATGDAVSGGWGQTNLALYGSSHVGILGGIIDTTNVSKILRLDLLKTDYFNEQAYPTYLYFNPYESNQFVNIDVGSETVDLYDAVSNSFLATGISGGITFEIPANAAVMLVLSPTGGNLTYELDKTLVNGVVIDYNSGQPVSNYPPRIKAVAIDGQPILTGQEKPIYCTATDNDGDVLAYLWNANAGTITGDSATVQWTAPESAGNYQIETIVSDPSGARDTMNLSIEVVESINHNPQIELLQANPRKINLGATAQILCSATDIDGDSLTFFWDSSSGAITGSDSIVTYIAPTTEGNYTVLCEVSDGRGGFATDSLRLMIRDLSNPQTGNMIAYYTFNGNANDMTGNGHDGVVHGAVLTEDQDGNANRAYYFDGNNDYISVPNNTALNVQSAITVSFWMNIYTLYQRESYPISHGNWENRWKVSLSNDHCRWTIKTNRGENNGIIDLDSESLLQADEFYHVVVLYNGSDLEIWLNGKLDAFGSWSGSLLQTSIDMTIGQALPSNGDFNFNGVLDDVRLYDYALSIQEIQNLHNQGTPITRDHTNTLPQNYILEQNYPNPFNMDTRIQFALPEDSQITIAIYDTRGALIKTLLHKKVNAGYHTVQWNGKDERGNEIASGIYFVALSTPESQQTRKIILLK